MSLTFTYKPHFLLQICSFYSLILSFFCQQSIVPGSSLDPKNRQDSCLACKHTYSTVLRCLPSTNTVFDIYEIICTNVLTFFLFSFSLFCFVIFGQLENGNYYIACNLILVFCWPRECRSMCVFRNKFLRQKSHLLYPCGYPCIIKGFTGQVHEGLARPMKLLLLCLLDALKAWKVTYSLQINIARLYMPVTESTQKSIAGHWH